MVSSIGNNTFATTGNTSLTITMGYSAPTVGNDMFNSVPATKNVTVRIPSGATGYTSAWSDSFKGGNSNVTVITQTY